MRYIFVFLFIGILSRGQESTIDSTSIEFKAKLMTVSRLGVADKEIIINDIENQKIEYLTTDYENFIFLKITLNQPFWNGKSLKRITYGNCCYYLSFNKKNKIFYRLGGFDYLDVDEFFRDLKEFEISNFIGFENVVEGIDINCLYKYYKMSSKQRVKNKNFCFPNCNEQIDVLGGR